MMNWVYHPYLADEDTQRLTQGQEQFSKLNLVLLGTFAAPNCADGQKAQLYSFHWLLWQRNQPTKLPLFLSSFSVVICIF